MKTNDTHRMNLLSLATSVSIRFENGKNLIWNADCLLEGEEFRDAVDAMIKAGRVAKPKASGGRRDV